MCGKYTQKEMSNLNPDDIKILGMTKELVITHMKGILEIDKKCLGFVGAWSEESYLTDYPDKWSLSNVALMNNQVAGLIVASIYKGNKAHLHRFIVEPDYQNQGIGQILNADFEKRCIKSQIENITVEFDGRVNAHGFYKKIGFREMSKNEILSYIEQKEKLSFKDLYLSNNESKRFVYIKEIIPEENK